MTLFTNSNGNETVHRSGPPSRTRKSLEGHIVQVFEDYSCTMCSLRKFRALGGGPELRSIAVPLQFVQRVIAMGKCGDSVR